MLSSNIHPKYIDIHDPLLGDLDIGRELITSIYQQAKKEQKSPRMIFENRSQNLSSWLSHVQKANAFALDPLYFPNTYTTPSDEAHSWFTHHIDAVAIRKRAELAKHVMANFAQNHLSKSEPVNAISLACGATYAMTDFALILNSLGYQDINIDAIDNDPKILKQLATKYAQNNNIITKHIDDNALAKPNNNALTMRTFKAHIIKDFYKLPFYGQNGFQGYDFVDALGIFEYLPHIWNKKPVMLPAILIHNAMTLLKPGGLFIFGNMNTNRPFREFLLKVVQWPYLQMRTPQHVVNIIKYHYPIIALGAKLTKQTHVNNAYHIPQKYISMYHTDDVYTIYAIQKPIET